MRLPKFLIGLLIGAAFALIVWYWQKSTSAEEGALAVLDRLAAAEARVRQLEAELRLAQKGEYPAEGPELLSGIAQLWGLQKKEEPQIAQQAGTPEPVPAQPSSLAQGEDDLQQINGIGPTYERRLKEAGIITFADLAAQTPERLRAVTGLQEWQSAAPEQWLAEAKELSED